MHCSQTEYTEGVLRKFEMGNIHPAPTPMVESFFSGLNAEPDKCIVDKKCFEQIIGLLLYLALRTRPEIFVAVLILARFQKATTSFYIKATTRILRYLSGKMK